MAQKIGSGVGLGDDLMWSGKPPVVTTIPSIVGVPLVGVASSYIGGLFSGVPIPAIAIQWLIDDTLVGGAAGPLYIPTLGDNGKILKVRVTATNQNGSVTSTSVGAVVGIG